MSKIRIATLVGLERDGTCGEGVTRCGEAHQLNRALILHRQFALQQVRLEV